MPFGKNSPLHAREKYRAACYQRSPQVCISSYTAGSCAISMEGTSAFMGAASVHGISDIYFSMLHVGHLPDPGELAATILLSF